MLKKFIERPVLSTVVSIILLLLGGLSLYTLPVTLFPDIAPPSVQVTAFYPGANAEVVARSVARSEEHTSELQSRLHLVCRLLLEKKKRNRRTTWATRQDRRDR